MERALNNYDTIAAHKCRTYYIYIYILISSFPPPPYPLSICLSLLPPSLHRPPGYQQVRRRPGRPQSIRTHARRGPEAHAHHPPLPRRCRGGDYPLSSGRATTGQKKRVATFLLPSLLLLLLLLLSLLLSLPAQRPFPPMDGRPWHSSLVAASASLGAGRHERHCAAGGPRSSGGGVE